MPDPQDQKQESTVTKTVKESAVTAEETSDEAEVATHAKVAVNDLESLQAELETAVQEVSKFQDTALRAEAEMQNLRRRSVIDLENAHKFSLEKFIQNLLPVVDSLEKGIESATQSADETSQQAIIDGVGLCHKMLIDTLTKEGLTVIDPQGEPFDPNLHQAISVVENPDIEPNSVVAVIQKGYTLNSRLMRPAMVMVSEPASKTDETG